MRTLAPHILVVDDHEATRCFLGRVLQQAGFTVDEATTAAQGFASIAAHEPDLILLDINLPDMSGTEMLRRLRVNAASIMVPVIHVSAAYVHGSDIGAALDSGADGYLTLPVDAAELIATVRAVLRTRRAEEAAHQFARQWQKTFDAISDAVCLVDRHGYVQRCNRAFCALTALTFGDIVGAFYVDLLTPVLGADALPVRSLDQLPSAAVVQTLSGQRWFRVAADPVFDDQGALTGAVLTVADMTPQKRVEDAMRRSNDELLTANRIKDEFLATLSHELRTPLNAIVGWTRLLRTGRLDERTVTRALETIDRNATLQAKLVEDLLDVSRIITGKLRLRIATIDPISVMEAAINSVRPAADAKGIRIDAQLDSDCGLISADGDRLQQVMWNLLSNAIKFTPVGGNVRLALRRGAGGLVIQVDDDGAGIEPGFLPYVFDRFRQADSSTTRHHGGLGLGLAIVRHLVELHGGTVQADSTGEGRGASFTLTLPWAARGTERARTTLPSLPTPAAAPLQSAPPSLLSGIRLVIVDDEADARELLAAAFTEMGADVHVVGDVDGAIEALARERPHVLVSDIGMPGQDGYSLVQRLRAAEKRDGATHLPAVALTAYATADDVKRAMAAGYDAHVAKPVDALTLAHTLVELVGVVAVDENMDATRPITLVERN
ncbi:MAG: sensor hybrid histidine kinase [Myxococcales bacterium]|nr:sensor hybrid histidine kinase [Myxococcales bacterium]